MRTSVYIISYCFFFVFAVFVVFEEEVFEEAFVLFAEEVLVEDIVLLVEEVFVEDEVFTFWK